MSYCEDHGNYRGYCKQTHTGCRFHDFKVVGDGKWGVLERCLLCGHYEEYKKGSDGSMDNVKYLKDHIRDFCQSTGSTAHIFKEIYGAKAVARSLQAKNREGQIDEALKEGQEAQRESLKFWRQMEGKGFTRTEILRMIESI